MDVLYVAYSCLVLVEISALWLEYIAVSAPMHAKMPKLLCNVWILKINITEADIANVAKVLKKMIAHT